MIGVLNKSDIESNIKIIENSWVIELPDNFSDENGLAKGTQILLTFKDEKIETEIVPPLSEKLENITNKLLKKRRRAFAELKKIGD